MPRRRPFVPRCPLPALVCPLLPGWAVPLPRPLHPFHPILNAWLLLGCDQRPTNTAVLEPLNDGLHLFLVAQGVHGVERPPLDIHSTVEHHLADVILVVDGP